MGGALEPLSQLLDRRISNRGPMLIEPGHSPFYPVGRCADFLNLFNVTYFCVGQGKHLTFKAYCTTSLSAILFFRRLISHFLNGIFLPLSARNLNFVYPRNLFRLYSNSLSARHEFECGISLSMFSDYFAKRIIQSLG
ncbi:hypothetical protein LP7551_01840 [Roseibium album]|nr:hypothetical protein LP7551_01840 [Roseibium album]